MKYIKFPHLFFCVCFIDNHLTRRTPPSYEDGVYMMAGPNRPNPRELSQRILKGKDGMPSVHNRTVLLAFFGKLKL